MDDTDYSDNDDIDDDDDDVAVEVDDTEEDDRLRDPGVETVTFNLQRLLDFITKMEECCLRQVQKNGLICLL